jgi:hypothetical protein
MTARAPRRYTDRAAEGWWGLRNIKQTHSALFFHLNSLSFTHHHAYATIHCTATSKQFVCHVYTIELCSIFPHFLRHTDGYRDAQLIHAGKGYAIMYSIWGRFHDILQRGSPLIEANSILLAPLQVLDSYLNYYTTDKYLLAVNAHTGKSTSTFCLLNPRSQTYWPIIL